MTDQNALKMTDLNAENGKLWTKFGPCGAAFEETLVTERHRKVQTSAENIRNYDLRRPLSKDST